MSKVYAASQSFCKLSAKQKPGDMIRAAGIELDVSPKGKPLTEAEVLALICDYDGIIAGAEPITARVIEQGTRLKIIAKNGVGYDNIDVKAATAKGIFVTFTPGAVEQTVADTTMGLIIALARHIVEGNTAMRKGEWPRIIGSDVSKKRLGIVGLGRIGKNVAARAKGFSMELYAYDPIADPVYCEQNGIQLVTLEILFRECDFVTIHAPLNDSTRHLVNAERLALMKPEALLINTSRGELVDVDALYEALKAKKIAGAAIDVFAKEPPGPDYPLFQLDNVILTPHIAGYSQDALIGSGLMVAESVVAALQGRIPPNLVNREMLAIA